MEVEQVTELLMDKRPCVGCEDWCEGTNRCKNYSLWIHECLNKLEKYEAAEKEGRLVVMPCKIGTPVFQISYTLNYGEIGDKAKINYFISQKRFNYNDFYRLGKTVFLTREKAERALENLENVEP